LLPLELPEELPEESDADDELGATETACTAAIVADELHKHHVLSLAELFCDMLL